MNDPVSVACGNRFSNRVSSNVISPEGNNNNLVQYFATSWKRFLASNVLVWCLLRFQVTPWRQCRATQYKKWFRCVSLNLRQKHWKRSSGMSGFNELVHILKFVVLRLFPKGSFMNGNENGKVFVCAHCTLSMEREIWNQYVRPAVLQCHHVKKLLET